MTYKKQNSVKSLKLINPFQNKTNISCVRKRKYKKIGKILFPKLFRFFNRVIKMKIISNNTNTQHFYDFIKSKLKSYRKTFTLSLKQTNVQRSKDIFLQHMRDLNISIDKYTRVKMLKNRHEMKKFDVQCIYLLLFGTSKKNENELITINTRSRVKMITTNEHMYIKILDDLCRDLNHECKYNFYPENLNYIKSISSQHPSHLFAFKFFNAEKKGLVRYNEDIYIEYELKKTECAQVLNKMEDDIKKEIIHA